MESMTHFKNLEDTDKTGALYMSRTLPGWLSEVINNLLAGVSCST